MMKVGSASDSRGFLGSTLGEFLVALTLFGVVLTMALSFMHVQNLGLRRSLDQMNAAQALRRASTVLERDLQTAGTHLVPGQPAIVYADTDIFAFNADYASRNPSDPMAVYFRPDLNRSATEVFPEGQKGPVGGSAFVYPPRTYLDSSGEPAKAETLIFFFSPDLDTPREDDFVLFRQVNSNPPQRIADRLLKLDGEPFFRYYLTGPEGMDSISDRQLPAAHISPVHGSPADTGVAALVDEIRGIRIALAVINGKDGGEERPTHSTRVLQLPNIPVTTRRGCGAPPALGPRLEVEVGHTPTGEPVVNLSWPPARDEVGGERDVVRYQIWRRTAEVPFGPAPYLSLPAGQRDYRYTDRDIRPGKRYQYALAAQDCTPGISPRIISDIVTPPAPLALAGLRQADGTDSMEDVPDKGAEAGGGSS